ncbi:MAG: hypothetical protein BIFFINMI_02808 [Phycisphaerae bacterium]|nr:hypothetical protein [Phycisphaerae bacterium]
MIRSATGWLTVPAMCLWAAAAWAQAPTDPGVAAAPDVGVLKGLAREAADQGPIGQSRRKQVAAQVQEGYLKDAAAARTIPLSDWHLFARCVGRDLSAADQTVWRQRLESAFAADVLAVRSLDAVAVSDLIDSLQVLGESRKVTAGLAWPWLSDYPTRRKASVAGQVQVALRTLGGEIPRDQQKQLADDLDKEWTAAQQKAPLSVQTGATVARFWTLSGDRSRRKAWVDRTYQAALGTAAAQAGADIATLSQVSDMLMQYGQTGEGHGYPEFAQVEARLAREGKLDGQVGFVQYLSVPLATPATRQAVRAELADAAGNPRLGVAQILTQAYKGAGKVEFKSWLDHLDGRVAQSPQPDQKAMWLLARAYVETFKPTIGGRRVILGKTYLDRALATAQSEAMRLKVVGKLVEYYQEMDHPEVGVEVLESMKGQFTGEQGVALLTMQQELRGEVAAVQARETQRHAASEQVRRQSRLDYYRDRLKRAESGGDSTTAQRLRGLIKALEQEGVETGG